MRTNVVIDDELMKRAMKATNLPTKKAVIDAGLRLLVEVKAQSGIRRLRGKVRFEGNLERMRRDRIQRG